MPCCAANLHFSRRRGGRWEVSPGDGWILTFHNLDDPRVPSRRKRCWWHVRGNAALYRTALSTSNIPAPWPSPAWCIGVPGGHPTTGDKTVPGCCYSLGKRSNLAILVLALESTPNVHYPRLCEHGRRTFHGPESRTESRSNKYLLENSVTMQGTAHQELAAHQR